jgi:hypothetical protein
MIRNQRGMITVDFLFAMVLILGFSGLLFVLTFTLAVASATQYITFAAARTYSAAHLDENTQIARGQAKYQELITLPVFKPLFSNGWYKVDAQANIGDHATQVPETEGYRDAIGGGGDVKDLFWGVGTRFVATVMDYHIPFFGSTNPDGVDGKDSGFKTYIGSYLGREPSAAECIEFTSKRWDHIIKLDSSYATGVGGNAKYYPQTDDGC